MTLSIFSCVYWPFISLLWEVSIQILWPFFIWAVFLITELYLEYIRNYYKSLIGYTIHIYFLLFHGLSFHFLDSVLQSIKLLNFGDSRLVFDPLWVNICVWCEVGKHFIMLPMDIQLSQHHLVKR